MAEPTLYLRNRRPNRVRIKYAGSVFNIERRGAREDTLSLPAEAENDPIIAAHLKQGRLEKISRDAFFELAARVVDEPQRELKGRAEDVNVEMLPEDHRTPTLVVDGSFNPKDPKGMATMSPKLEFAEEPQSTESEIAQAGELAAERERVAAEQARAEERANSPLSQLATELGVEPDQLRKILAKGLEASETTSE